VTINSDYVERLQCFVEEVVQSAKLGGEQAARLSYCKANM